MASQAPKVIILLGVFCSFLLHATQASNNACQKWTDNYNYEYDLTELTTWDDMLFQANVSMYGAGPSTVALGICKQEETYDPCSSQMRATSVCMVPGNGSPRVNVGSTSWTAHTLLANGNGFYLTAGHGDFRVDGCEDWFTGINVLCDPTGSRNQIENALPFLSSTYDHCTYVFNWTTVFGCGSSSTASHGGNHYSYPTSAPPSKKHRGLEVFLILTAVLLTGASVGSILYMRRRLLKGRPEAGANLSGPPSSSQSLNSERNESSPLL